MRSFRPTEGRSRRYAAAFGVIGLVSLVPASAGLPWSAWGVWAALDLLLVAHAYVQPAKGIFEKREGTLPLARKIVLLPYLGVVHAVLWALRTFSREPPHATLVDGIVIGRRLRMHEYPAVTTLVDLTAELDEHVPEGATLVSFPILDGAPADAGSLRTMAQSVSRAPRPVYLHCAQGHGRTSMFAAAVLIELGAARSVSEALAAIVRARPGARPNREQRRLLDEAYGP